MVMNDVIKDYLKDLHKGNVEIDGYKLVMTCRSMPEQYDVFKDGVQVGYLRLRHGYFYASVPDCSNDIVYEANPKGDGSFYPDERDFYLKEAVKAIEGRYV